MQWLYKWLVSLSFGLTHRCMTHSCCKILFNLLAVFRSLKKITDDFRNVCFVVKILYD